MCVGDKSEHGQVAGVSGGEGFEFEGQKRGVVGFDGANGGGVVGGGLDAVGGGQLWGALVGDESEQGRPGGAAGRRLSIDVQCAVHVGEYNGRKGCHICVFVFLLLWKEKETKRNEIK